MSETKRIINLVVSIIASLAAPVAIICIINEPTQMFRAFGIILGITLLLMVVEMLSFGFSSEIESYPSFYAFVAGFGLTFIAGSAVMLYYSHPIWLGIIMAVTLAIISWVSYIGGFVLGSLIQSRD